MEIFDVSWKVEKRGTNRTVERRELWLDGCVATPWGYVICYAQGDDENFHHTRLDFIHGGRVYCRNFNGKRYSVRGIKTKAVQFAKEIAANTEGDG